LGLEKEEDKSTLRMHEWAMICARRSHPSSNSTHATSHSLSPLQGQEKNICFMWEYNNFELRKKKKTYFLRRNQNLNM